MKTTISALALGVTLAFSGTAGAGVIDIDNAGFEADPLGDGVWIVGATDWVAEGSAGVWDPSAAAYPSGAFGGENVAWSNGGSLIQELDEVFAEDTSYTLSVWVGNRADWAFATHSIELWAGDTLLASASGATPGVDEWQELTAVFDGSLLSRGEIEADNLVIVLSGDGAQVNFDDVTLIAEAAVVPAPAALALLGMAGIAGRRRRRNGV